MKHLTVTTAIAVTIVSLAVVPVKGEQNMVESGKKIKMDYTLKVDGEVVDTSVGREPLEYTQGQNQIIPGLEKRMEGMTVGEERTITVPSDEAYGPSDPQLTREFPKSAFPQGLELKPGMILPLQGPEGQTIPATVKEIREDVVVLDFNHPLAGKDLTFDVKVLDIQDNDTSTQPQQ